VLYRLGVAPARHVSQQSGAVRNSDVGRVTTCGTVTNLESGMFLFCFALEFVDCGKQVREPFALGGGRACTLARWHAAVSTAHRNGAVLCCAQCCMALAALAGHAIDGA
jgi:hypothetical protein